MSTELFDRATEYAGGVLSELTNDDLQRPTPCAGWDAKRMVLHLADVVDGLSALLETGTLALPQSPLTHDPDPVALVHGRLEKLTHAFSVATDETRVENAAVAGAVELTVHGWDLGTSRSRGHRIPESLAEDVLALVSPTLDDSARGENFAAPIDVPVTASAGDRLVAFLGRMPRH